MPWLPIFIYTINHVSNLIILIVLAPVHFNGRVCCVFAAVVCGYASIETRRILSIQ
ncbi:uncharacterized protein BJX67DRAFT_362889 [Aspergillus lucknowensis]|uniref:Uncharacterized protein n=1 Tax=Aspergillus lucknowensis TaxID=176173 RepID=A0ABR4LGX8_9EURO